MRAVVRLYIVASVMCAAAGVQAAPLTEESCSVLATTRGSEKPAMHEAPGLSVVSLSPDKPLAISAEDGVTINGIVCWRSEARFSENDYLVPDAGFPLFVKMDAADESKSRTLVLERVGGAFRIRLVSGPSFSEAESDEIQHLLNLYTAKVNDRGRTIADAKPSDTRPLSPNAPQDKPYSVARGERQTYEQAIAPYVKRAKETWPDAKRRYLAGLPEGHIFFVTTRLRDSQDRWESTFVRVQSIRDGVISGLIANHLQIIGTHKFGDGYSFREAEVLDWTIARPDGSEEGNVVGKFLDTVGADAFTR